MVMCIRQRRIVARVRFLLSIRHTVTSKFCAILVAYHLLCNDDDDDPCVRLISERFISLVASCKLLAAPNILLFYSCIVFEFSDFDFKPHK